MNIDLGVTDYKRACSRAMVWHAGRRRRASAAADWALWTALAAFVGEVACALAGEWGAAFVPGEPRAQALAKSEEKPVAAERAVSDETLAGDAVRAPLPRGRPALTVIRGGR